MARGICILYLILAIEAKAQIPKGHIGLMTSEKLKAKLTLIDLTIVSLPAVKAQGEYVFFNGRHPVSAGLDLGYIFYSADEGVKASGYTMGGRINFYTKSTEISTFSTSLSGFGSKTHINDYLKYTSSYPGFGSYHYYEKTKYTKMRFGGALELVWQRKLVDLLFAEMTFGLGIVDFETRVPEEVTQETFVNGVITDQHYKGPTVLFSLKLGYSIL